MADNWWEDTSWMEGIEDNTSFLDDNATNYYGADDLSWLDDLDTSFLGDDIDMDSEWWEDKSWMEGIEDDTSFLDMFDDTNYYGADQDMTSNIDYNDLFDKEGNFTGYNYESPFTPEDETGIFGGTAGPKMRKVASEFFSKLIGGGSGGGKKTGGGITDLLSALAGGSKNMLDNDLIKILLGKKLLDDDRKGGSAAYVPIGQEAYGGGGGQPSYQISNIQPALLPGMAYANQPTTYNADPPPTAPPPGMQGGGLASHNHPQLHSHAHGSRPNDIPGMPGMQDLLLRPDGMQGGGIASLENRMEGPGDITKAMLEPGEFVMTRKATENLTPEYLYNLMNQAENAGRRR